MAPAAPHIISRSTNVKIVGYSSSPTDKQPKALAAHVQYGGYRAGSYWATNVVSGSSHRGAFTLRSDPAVPALPDSTAAAATSPNLEFVSDTPVNPETVQLVTAATILSNSDSDSDTAETIASYEEDDSMLSDPLAYLDDLTMLDADSLSLAIGILRQHQPVSMDETDVLLSERLRDLLVLLHQRPSSADSSTNVANSMSTALPGTLGQGDSADSVEDDFWAGQDEWSDVRCALMSIGINASLEEDDEEDVWTLEEEGPARRTRLLRSLPRLTPEAAQDLSAFLAVLQQQRAEATGALVESSRSASAAVAAEQEHVGIQEEEKWWEQVTEAYQKLWQQAKVQQAKQAAT